MNTTVTQPKTAPSPAPGRNLWKTLPGLLISAFFLWYTFRHISFAEIRALRVAAPAWFAGVLIFTAASYALRCVRWARMMRSTGASLAVCARVLMTSLAANNILPFRIGDIMRVFTYAPDLGAAPSAILSTVILEKLLDVFVVGLMFVLTMGKGLPVKVRHGADAALAISAVGLLVLMFGARQLEGPVRSLFARLPQSKLVQKLEHWLLLAIDTLRQMGIAGSLLLLIQTVVIWSCEAMIYVSAVRLVGISVDLLGPWEAVSFGNLSYMLPSSPGAIGTFEWAVKTSLVSHGAQDSQAALFALALHAWLLISVTGVGGIVFLIHRAKIHNHTPLLEEIETLPAKLP
jgi:glycosyltransferase 2 family protein